MAGLTATARSASGTFAASSTRFSQNEQELLQARQANSAWLRRWLSLLIGAALFAATLLAAVLAVATRQAVTGLLSRTREHEEESKLRHEAELVRFVAEAE